MKQILHQNEVLKRRIEQITGLIPELMECRSPLHVFFFLKKIFMEDRSPSISTPLEFYDAFQYFSMTLKNLLCELYLHNLAVPNDTEGNLVLYVGETQLRAEMS